MGTLEVSLYFSLQGILVSATFVLSFFSDRPQR